MGARLTIPNTIINTGSRSPRFYKPNAGRWDTFFKSSKLRPRNQPSARRKNEGASAVGSVRLIRFRRLINSLRYSWHARAAGKLFDSRNGPETTHVFEVKSGCQPTSPELASQAVSYPIALDYLREIPVDPSNCTVQYNIDNESASTHPKKTAGTTPIFHSDPSSSVII
jgi:hypothetical protein